MATTTNFGWETPDDTDLVKDGALAIRTLGSAIDTSLVDLKGGTTGQVLSKTSNTDMDFTWVTSDDANAIQNAIVDAKGDLITATAADTPARLAVGANDLLLTADSTTATGLAYTGGWTTWTPTLTNMSQGNGTITARYCKIGKVVTFYFLFELGSTSTMGTGPTFTLPFSTSHIRYLFPVNALDNGVTNYFLNATINGAGTGVSLYDVRASGTYVEMPGATTATVPFTWGNGDWFSVNGSYEVA